MERLSSISAAIPTAKWASLTPKKFQRLVFLKRNLDFLKWQGIAQTTLMACPARLVNK